MYIVYTYRLYKHEGTNGMTNMSEGITVPKCK